MTAHYIDGLRLALAYAAGDEMPVRAAVLEQVDRERLLAAGQLQADLQGGKCAQCGQANSKLHYITFYTLSVRAWMPERLNKIMCYHCSNSF